MLFERGQRLLGGLQPRQLFLREQLREPPRFGDVQGVLGDPPPPRAGVPLGLDLPGVQPLQDAALGNAKDLGDLRRGVEVPRHRGLRTRRTAATNWSAALRPPERLRWPGEALPLPPPARRRSLDQSRGRLAALAGLPTRGCAG